MDTPKIRYAKTDDAVNIGYVTLGKGPPLVFASNIYGEAYFYRIGWRYVTWVVNPLLKLGWQVVLYDVRGMGSSDRDVPDVGLEKRVLDVEAVVNRLGIRQFVLAANDLATPTAIAYAAKHPAAVSRLVLIHPWASAAHRFSLPGYTFFMASELRNADDWGVVPEILANVVTNFQGDLAKELADAIRGSTSPKQRARYFDATAEIDVTGLLGTVRAPTLVVQMPGQTAGSFELCQEVAAGIPDSTLVVLRDKPLDAVIDEFLRATPTAATDNDSTTPTPGGGAFRTILFTDLEAHTAMMQRLGDARGREVLREHERISREALRAHGGTEVKTIGDSFMASFPSAQKAVECAIALQRAFQQPISVPNSASPSPSTEPVLSSVEGRGSGGEVLRIRVGINAGEPIADEDDLFGASVILASRTKEKAAGGEIFVTDVVRQLVAGKGFAFTDRGEMEMKGFEEPVRLYEVRWRNSD